ncbi:LysR family transcriptional regulator [uncultured Jannaschia sp.]|uniref:LysR family transcriptional regulator n=1 Tax=uncultured Jannaschia sp. TaxID=293347 RepID=UPI002626D9EA|nr:LysR family transcriptional regulator [uncultured Jannaschia sp.]
MFAWDDLKVFLAVACNGSTLAAGRALRINQSTVQRRLLALEERLGQRLVERLPSGYRLTELGTAILPFAETVAAAAQGFEDQLAELARDRLGIIRVTCPEPIAFRLNQSGLLDRFHAAYPDLKVEFVLSDHYVDLLKGEADVALRSGDTDANVLVGRKIADSLWAIYASRQYVERHGGPRAVSELAEHPLIGFAESMRAHRISVWLHEVAPDGAYAAHNTSVLGLIYAAKAGVGVAPLPMSLGDAETDLVRLFGPIPALTRPWRLLAHPDQRRTRRVSAFFTFITQEADTMKAILTGQS